MWDLATSTTLGATGPKHLDSGAKPFSTVLHGHSGPTRGGGSTSRPGPFPHSLRALFCVTIADGWSFLQPKPSRLSVIVLIKAELHVPPASEPILAALLRQGKTKLGYCSGVQCTTTRDIV